jgi:hemolysin activation/secretion protein/AraC-like DNA-binding protein
MIAARHLVLQEISLRPSGEWTPGGGWTVVRAAEGAGYCLQTGTARELNAGDMVVVGPQVPVVFRASQLGVFKLEYFQVLPQCLNGLLTVTEWRQLEDKSGETAMRLRHFAASDPAAQKFTRLAAQPQRDGLAARSALLQLWAACVTSLLPAAGLAATASNLRERFRQFVGKMSEAELAVRPLTQLAEELHCSERHFSRLFREEFSVSLRARQTELRLQRARQLLAESDAKIINVAFESGYRHLGLFNAMFKRRFGVTPSQWRHQNPAPPPPNPTRRSGLLLLLLLLFLSPFFLIPKAMAQSANSPARKPPAANVATNAGPRFQVEKYLVNGNTVLTPGQLDRILTNLPAAFGTNVSFADIRAALGDLQMAYQERGYVTVKVWLPQQRLTNAEVKINVTEGRLADIRVEGNKWFSTPNVLRALPSLHTNRLLNSHVLQQELDAANLNRNRQIYPVIGPGPDPGTTELTLKVKDRLPLHARAELNDVSTPGTPFTRAVFSGEYDNLWGWEHQLGVSYTFSPVTFHGVEDYYWWPLDLPQVANYSVFYRMPLGPVQPVQQQIDQSDGHFGYNEVTHQFDLPPPTGRPELTLYASRSLTDTGVQLNNFSNVVQNVRQTIVSYDAGQNITLNEDIGAKVAWPMPPLGKLATTLSVGADLKHFQQVSYNSNNFVETQLFTNTDGSVTPITDNIGVPQPVLRTEVYYLPVNAGISGSLPDSWGTTLFNAQANFNLATFNGYTSRTLHGTNVSIVATNSSTVRGGLGTVAGNTNIHNSYITIQMGADRVQRVYKDWTVKLHADGQWANGPLFSNEQYGMGGIAGVRGYQDGFAYGDAGWRMSIEPQTPLVQIGDVDGDTPFWIRASVFMDYGQALLLHGGYFPQVAYVNGPVVGKIPGNAGILDLWGAGWAISFNVGNHIDGRLTMGFPLANPGVQKGWSPLDDMRLYFAIGGQF